MDQGEIKFPCLFDRLIDDDPGSKEEPRAKRYVSMKEYRAAILRDLRWLLNAPRQPPSEPIHDYPEAAKSVLNFGTRDLGGLTAESLPKREIENDIKDAILTFEPRILAHTLEVKLLTTASQPGHIAFEIRGMMWALPSPELLFIRSELDLETGSCELTEDR